MNYKQLVKAAGYKAEQAEYIARKLDERNVPQNGLNNLANYFPRSTRLAGVELGELGVALYSAAEKMTEKKAVSKEKLNDGAN